MISSGIELVKQTWFLLARKDSQAEGFSAIRDDFDKDMIIGNTSSAREENVVVNEGTNDRDFTVGTSNNDSVVNGNAISVKTLERCFNERIDREMNNIVDTVEDRIQNAILTAIENIVAPKIELAIRSINASSGRDTTSVSANSERGERVGINASFENASKNNDTLDVSNVNDETRQNNPDEVSELSASETHFDWQPQTHHTNNDCISARIVPKYLCYIWNRLGLTKNAKFNLWEGEPHYLPSNKCSAQQNHP